MKKAVPSSVSKITMRLHCMDEIRHGFQTHCTNDGSVEHHCMSRQSVRPWQVLLHCRNMAHPGRSGHERGKHCNRILVSCPPGWMDWMNTNDTLNTPRPRFLIMMFRASTSRTPSVSSPSSSRRCSKRGTLPGTMSAR